MTGLARVRAFGAALMTAGTVLHASVAAPAVAAARPDQPAKAAGAPVPATIVDDWGRALRFDRAPLRIVSLAPHATELLIAAGAAGRLVAVDNDSDDPSLPPGVTRLAAYPAPQIERVLALRPDLVVLWGAAVRRELVDRLPRMGVAVFVSDPRGHRAIAETLARFGAIGGDPAIAAAAVERMRRGIDAIGTRYTARAPVRVFVQVWNRPLMTLSDRDGIAEALALCGAVNVFADAGRPALAVGSESVLAAEPELILAFEPAGDEQPWRGLGVLAPQGRIGFEPIPRALQRPSQRLADAIAVLCGVIDRHRRAM